MAQRQQTTSDYIPPVEDIKLKKDGRYYVGFTYTEPNGNEKTGKGAFRPRRFKGGAYENEGEAWGAVHAWRDGMRAMTVSGDTPTVVEVYTSWCQSSPKERGKLSTADYIGRHIEAYWKARPITELTGKSFVDFQTWLSERLAPRTTNVVTGFLSASVTQAMAHRSVEVDERTMAMPKDYAPPVKLRKDRLPTEDACWHMSRAERKRLWDICVAILAADTTPHDQRTHPRKLRWRYALWCILALETAGRATAVDHVEWSRVNFQTKKLKLQPSYWKVNEKKTNAEVPMSGKLIAVLKAEYAKRGGNTYVLGTPTTTQHTVPDFLADLAVQSINIEFPDETRLTARHDFRRTWASHALMDGLAPAKVAGFLGDRVDTVLTYYARFIPDDSFIDEIDELSQKQDGAAVARPRKRK